MTFFSCVSVKKRQSITHICSLQHYQALISGIYIINMLLGLCHNSSGFSHHCFRFPDILFSVQYDTSFLFIYSVFWCNINRKKYINFDWILVYFTCLRKLFIDWTTDISAQYLKRSRALKSPPTIIIISAVEITTPHHDIVIDNCYFFACLHIYFTEDHFVSVRQFILGSFFVSDL